MIPKSSIDPDLIDPGLLIEVSTRFPAPENVLIWLPEEYKSFRVFRVIPGLLLGNMPFKARHINALAQINVGTVVNLCELREYDALTRPCEREDLKRVYAEKSIQEVLISSPDVRPPSKEVFDRSVEAYRNGRMGGKEVVVHCRGGAERSAAVAAAVLCACEGYSVDDALAQVMSVAEDVQPLWGQEEAFREWAEAQE